VPIRHKICGAGNVGVLLFSLVASAALAQQSPGFRTGASSTVQFSPPGTLTPDQFQSRHDAASSAVQFAPPTALTRDQLQARDNAASSAAQFPPPMALTPDQLQARYNAGASAAQFPPPMAPLSDQSQILDMFQLLNSSPPAGSTQSPTSAQLPVQFRIQSSGLSTNAPARPVAQRVLEIPVGFERHPTRNLTPAQGSEPFTLRNTSADDVQTQLSLSLQMDVRHDDDLDSAPRPLEIVADVAEYTPSLQLNIGSIPSPRHAIGGIPGTHKDLSLESENYLEIQYLPTIYDRLDTGTSRTLQRIIGEAGRANAMATTALRVEYDENLFVTSDTTSPEDTYTLLEISPFMAYSPSAKTSLVAQAFYRRITIQNSTTNRTEYVLDVGVDCETSAKTSVGIGTELGHITFDDPEFATQDYQQGYLAWAWKPTATITFQTHVGVELREFANQSKPNRTSPITTTVLNWQPNEQTSVSFGIRVQNQPSVSQNGALFQEVRMAADVRHEIGWNLYVRGEVDIDHRNYDSGLTQTDVVFRPAFGYHTEVSRLFDSLNIEAYYQFQQRYSDQLNSNFGRNIFGLQSTIYF